MIASSVGIAVNNRRAINLPMPADWNKFGAASSHAKPRHRKENVMNAWVFLAFAIVLEIVGTSLLKMSQGFARPWIGAASIVAYSICFWLMAFAITRIPVGVAYAIWSGVGILAIALIGWLAFRQSLSLAQIGFIALILVGVVGLNLSTPAEPKASSPQSSA